MESFAIKDGVFALLNFGEIADGLCLSMHTVNTHRINMLKKLEASNTAELLMMARDMNLQY